MKDFRFCAEINQGGHHKVKTKQNKLGFSLSTGHLTGIQEVSKVGGETDMWQLQYPELSDENLAACWQSWKGFRDK